MCAVSHTCGPPTSTRSGKGVCSHLSSLGLRLFFFIWQQSFSVVSWFLFFCLHCYTLFTYCYILFCFGFFWLFFTLLQFMEVFPYFSASLKSIVSYSTVHSCTTICLAIPQLIGISHTISFKKCFQAKTHLLFLTVSLLPPPTGKARETKP